MWADLVGSALLCVRANRWKKASKCKNLIMQLQTHLIIQKKRRHSIIKHSGADIAQLLQIGSLNALTRVEQHYRDKCLLDAYDQIEHFCESIITNLSHISKCSAVQNLPTNVTVAVASLIFAASRCGELPQLHLIRNFFRERYGKAFDIASVELSVGNFVDLQLKKSLRIKVVPEDEKLKLLQEIISQDQTFPLGFKDLKQNFQPQLRGHYYASEQKPEVMDVEMHDTCSDSDEAWVQSPRHVIRRKVWATPPNTSHIDSRRRSSPKDSLSARSRTSSEGMPRTPRMSIAYLDEKSVNKEDITGKHARKGLEPWAGNLSYMSHLGNKRKVVVSPETQFGHAHPKMPYYEDVAVKLKGAKGK